MNVRQILAEKGSTAVETVTVDTSIAQVARKLSERKIGALVVSDGDEVLAGIISERDLVRALSAHGSLCLERPVSDFMTRDVVCADPAESLDKVLETMTNHRFRHMPVLADGKLAGVVSIGDAVKARIEGLERENAALADWIRSG